MLSLKSLALDTVDWAELDRLPDRTIFQTRPWLEFVARTQRAEPAVAALQEDGRTCGYFTGLIVTRFGLRILGSPFKGWTTAYMGFNLLPGVCRRAAMAALIEFAFGELRCVHLELMDRHLTVENAACLGLDYYPLQGFEIDLAQSEDQLFSAMTGACRRCIRKAEREGVVIEEADDAGFVDDYYAQLQDVFAKQGLVPTYPKERVQALIDCLAPTGRLLLLRARAPDGRCIATGIFPAMNDTMLFWGGASWRADQHRRPNELIQWHAIRYWKARGIQHYDMGGGGEYKRKYGGQEICIPWLRRSRYQAVAHFRDTARRLARTSQRLSGCLGAKRIGSHARV
jgi:CelD/BcsL family acetyltransferase involved in cellulose biosynthesis